MQNEPNLPKAQMNVNKVLTKDYENKPNWTLGENEPKTNPIKANFRGKKMLLSIFRRFVPAWYAESAGRLLKLR
jgi:hypothetical protein